MRRLDRRVIEAARPPKNRVDPSRAYAALVEPERSASGRVEDVATIFLTNRECPYRCLMCDLWKNTTDVSVPHGSIPRQIDAALSGLPPARHVKLYNSGNFFDAQAIPPEDHASIAERLTRFATVIVENHPNLVDDRCFVFRDRLAGRLEIAMGLETIHPRVLPLLNKQMTADDFRRAAGQLRDHDIDVRAFVLLRPPFLDEEEGIEWAVRSVAYALEAGAQTVAVIPTRPGNGILDELQREGHFARPRLASLERTLDLCLEQAPADARIFVDLWDLESLSRCDHCFPRRRERLIQINHSQQSRPPIACTCSEDPV